jgi:hypothetical protein
MKLPARATYLLMACIVASSAGAAAVPDPTPLAVAGGALDPTLRPRDIYLGTPTAAVADPATACTVAERYVAAVNARRYPDIAALFAADGTFYEPSQAIARGRAAIEDAQRRIGVIKPQIVPVAYVGNRTDCMVELAVGVEIDGKPRSMLVSIDHFTIDDKGLATRMIAFARSRPNDPLLQPKAAPPVR